MSNKSDNGLAETLAAFDRIARAPREAVIPAMVRQASKIADTQKTFAPKDTGALAESIAVTLPGHTTPPYSQPGGSRVAGETEVIITAGNTDVRYAHNVEYGTSKMAAHPFFWVGFRLRRLLAQRAIDRAGRKAVRDAWNGK